MEKHTFIYCKEKFVIEYNEDTRNVNVDGNPEHDTDEKFVDYVSTINGLTQEQFENQLGEEWIWDEIVAQFMNDYERKRSIDKANLEELKFYYLID